MGTLCPQKLNYEKKTTGACSPSMDGKGKQQQQQKKESASLGLW